VFFASLTFAFANLFGYIGFQATLLALLVIAPMLLSAICCIAFDRDTGRRVVISVLLVVLSLPLLLAFLKSDTPRVIQFLFSLYVFWTPQIAVIAFVSPSWKAATETTHDH